MFDLDRIETLLILIPALPLLSAVVTAVLGPKVLRHKSHWPTLAALVISCGLSLLLVVNVWQHAHAVLGEATEADTSDREPEAEAETGAEEQPESKEAGTGADEPIDWSSYRVDLWRWAVVKDAYTSTGGAAPPAAPHSFDIGVTLQADPLTAIMLAMVTFVSLLVAIYSVGYMHGDRGYWRFFAYMGLFVFSMTMLVSASNFVLLYVFWEAVGLCSYLLIGFWYEKPQAAAAGKKAFLVNRVGDFGFALALFLIWITYGTLNFHDTEAAPGILVPGVLGQTMLAEPGLYVGGGVGLAICLLLMLGACGKSAQLPLHVWLPDAMEGPTPVSALIHAATMVTAGVYMVTRCVPLFMVSAEAQLTVACIGGLTALMAGLIALTQNDLKRILAYSTISQLGFMFLALGTGSLLGVVAGMFHLLTHAFFKALFFLGAGSVMHAMGGVIDIRRFGGLRRLMPITHVTFLAGCLALAGVAPFAGFWSKDAILHAVHEKGHHSGLYLGLFYAGKLTALLTALYTFRAFFLTFYGQQRLPPEAGRHAHESPASMTVPLGILAAGAVVVGFVYGGFAELVRLTPSLAYAPVVDTGPAYVALDWNEIVAGTGTALIGIALAALLYLGNGAAAKWFARRAGPLYRLAYGKFFFDPIYRGLVVWPGLALAALSAWIDDVLVDGLVNLAGRAPGGLGTALRYLQAGLVPLYAVLMVLGLLALVGSMFL